MSENVTSLQTEQTKRRYDNIDKLKALCAFWVVCIHAPFMGEASEYVTAVARIKRISGKVLLLIITATVSTTLLERYLLVSSHLNAKRDHYISTTIIARIGRNDSTWIYILHPMVMTVLHRAFAVMSTAKVTDSVFPIAVFIVTAAAVEVLTMVKKRLLGH